MVGIGKNNGIPSTPMGSRDKAPVRSLGDSKSLEPEIFLFRYDQLPSNPPVFTMMRWRKLCFCADNIDNLRVV